MCRERENRIILSVFVLVVLCSILKLQGDSFAQPARTSNYLNLPFRHLTIEDGLSQGMVNAIYQDRQGFLWFGTKAGLNRYDGYRFTIFRNNPFDSTSLSNNYVQTIFGDHRGRLWIGTSDGLNCFDPATEKFRRFLHELSDDNITAIGEAPPRLNEVQGITVLWIGTLNGGLNKLVLRENDAAQWELPSAMRMRNSNREKQADHYFVKHQHNPADSKSLGSNRIWDLLVDQSGILWIGTDRGLCRLDPPHSLSASDDQSVNFTRYVHNAKEASSLLDNKCHSLYETREGSIWVGTGKGLARMTPASGSSGAFENHEYPGLLLLSPTANTIFEICEDRRGALWLVTYQGLLIFDTKEETYHWVRHDSDDPASLSYDGVRSIFRDRSDAIWIGTTGFGLSRWDPHRKQFHAYTPEKLKLASGTDLSIYAMLEDRRGLMWIFANKDWYQFDRKTGSLARRPLNFAHEEVNNLYEDHAGFLWITNNAGVSRYDARSRQIEKIFPQSDESKLILGAIYEDNNGDMWFGSVSTLADNPEASASRRHALYRWNRETAKVTEYPIPATFKGGWLEIRRIAQDRNGMFWLATNNGLFRFRPQSGALKIFQNEPGNRASLTNNDVKTLMADPLQPHRFIWLGTNGGGLNRLDLATETFSHYMEEHGLPNNVVCGILSDNAGNLWMSTNKGLSKALVVTNARAIVGFKSYDVGDGLQSNEFNTNAYFKSAPGEMFFGGIKGFNVFHPDSIKENSSVPPVVFTDFLIRYQNVNPGQRGSPLRKTINTTEAITLSPKDNVMAIEFAALDYSAPEKNLYSYKLENFDEGWSQPRRSRRATYTNLKPGKYVFRVRGSNNDGVWNETGASLAIEIKPYFYQTAWFATLCALALGLTVYGGHRWRLRFLEARQRELEKLVAERTIQLREVESFRLIAEASPVAISVTRCSDGEILYANRNTGPILGLPHHRLIGRKALDFYDDPAEYDKILETIKQHGRLQDHEMKIKRADGTSCYGLISCQQFVFHGEPALLTGYQDVTAHKLAEAALKTSMDELRASKERYRALYDDNPFVYFTLDAQGTVLSVNHYGVEQIGYAAVELIGQPLTKIFHDEDKDKALKQVELCLQNSMVNYYELRTIRKDGSLLWVGEYARAMQASNGETVVLIVCDNITARKQAETALKKSLNELQTSRERLRALSAHLQSSREQERVAIARDLHDELGQALTSLKMDMSMLERKAKSASGKFDGAAILGDIETMQKLITGTINKVRSLITELRPEVLDTLGLVPALEWQIEEFHKHTDLAYEFNTEVEELHLSKEHAVAVFRIFQESLTNIARHAHASKVTAKIEKHDDALWVEITDDGHGITTEELNTSGKFGLLGMRERALVFGGEVSITGTPGRGTTVKIKVPIPGG